MASLPVEIFTEILARLPVKLLLRFLCVSKLWYSLIKNPNFIKLHLNKTLISNSETYLIACSEHIADLNLECIQNTLSFSKLRHPLETDAVNVIGSCNGILCISDICKKRIVLYNPLTNSHREFEHNINFSNPEIIPVIDGFGYDSVTDDYKVFCSFCKFDIDQYIHVAEVFSLKSNSWKSVEGIDFDIDRYQSSFYFDGAICFVAYVEDFGPDLIDALPWIYFICKFDLSSDTVSRVELPKLDDKFCDDEIMLEPSALNGCLCMFVNYFRDEYCDDRFVRFDLWMRKKCGEIDDWVRLFSIPDPHSIGAQCYICTIVCSNDGSRVLLCIDGSKLGWYDLDNGSFETITTRGLPEISCSSTLCYFSGSLVSLVEDK